MNDITKWTENIINDFRYGITQISFVILGLLLIFHKELSFYMREVLIPSLAIYALGTGLIAFFQVILTVSANTKAQADHKEPRGISEKNLTGIIITHISWFVLLILYNVFRALCG